MAQAVIQNSSRPLPEPILAKYCATFFSKFRGLMLQPTIIPFNGILLVERKESRMDTAIHMLFMRFDIAVVWIDDHQTVVDVRLARKWQPMLVPAAPARFVLETHPVHLSWFTVGDRVEITHD